jgi:hypothetical protein
MKFLILLFVILLFAISAYSQCPEVMPDGTICLSRAAAQKAVETAKELDATKAQLKTEQQAFTDLLKELNNQRVQNAEQAGRIFELEKNAIEDRAEKELLLKSVKKQCKFFSICLF